MEDLKGSQGAHGQLISCSLVSFFQTPKTAGLRPMEKKDIPVVHQLLSRYLKQFHLTPVMSQEEVEHWFYPQENIIDTFVVEVSGDACSGPLPHGQGGILPQ